MTSRGYDPRQSPGLGYKRVVSCKDSFHGTDVLAVSERNTALRDGARTSTLVVAGAGGGSRTRDLLITIDSTGRSAGSMSTRGARRRTMSPRPRLGPC